MPPFWRSMALAADRQTSRAELAIELSRASSESALAFVRWNRPCWQRNGNLAIRPPPVERTFEHL